MTARARRAILLVDHGSRRAEANALLERVARLVAVKAGPEMVVRHAHLELAPPTVPEGLAACVAAGAREIAVHPYMLAPGRHAAEDIPRLVAEAAALYPEVNIRVTEPLGLHPAISELVLERCGLPVVGETTGETTMTDKRVIDMWAPLLPVPEMVKHVVGHFPAAMLGYLRVFWKLEPTAEALAQVLAGRELPEEQVVALLDAGGIGRSLITGFDETTNAGMAFMSNEVVAGVAERHPGRFIPFAGIDVGAGMRGVRELERLVRERGFRGLSLRPFMTGLPADDRRYYPLYAKCVELDIPVSVHSSANWSAERDNELGHPRHLGVVATDFPELKLIVSHGGYPWVLEAVLLAWKHEHLYLELAAHRPRYFATPGTGWEPLMRFGQTTIQDKVLFGTGWFLIGRPPGELLAEFRSLPLEPRVLDKWLFGNAERLLGLASAPP
ncbi:MAG: amidohydrolase family protein [Deltaproteobacteria bacterium]|nr:amidohydrolase family protein [Deltaproteobacteria bacterium]